VPMALKDANSKVIRLHCKGCYLKYRAAGSQRSGMSYQAIAI
jgi:hypothetical protein